MSYKRHLVEWTPELISRFWDERQTEGPETEWFTYQVGKDLVKYVNRKIRIQGNVLDYGCGKGHLINQILKMTPAYVSGCDFSSESVAYVNDHFLKKNRFQQCFLVDGSPLPIKPGNFNCVFFLETIEHLKDEMLVKAIAALDRNLSKEGYLIVTTPNNEKLEERTVCCPECGAVFHRMQHVRSFDVASLTKLFENHGLKTVDCRAVNLRGYTRWWGIHRFLLFALHPRRHLKKPHLVYIGRK
jgi:SAM-dependent methyltransferase